MQYILIGNFNMYYVCTHVVPSIIKLHKEYIKIQGKFKYKYTNNNTHP